MGLSRKQSREAAFRMLFSLAFDKESEVFSGEALELACDKEKPDSIEGSYIKKLCEAVKSNLAAIDNLIISNAKDFSFDRIFKVDLTALRMSIGEIMFVDETPDIVAINEAVELVKKYSTEKSAAYINGILAAVLRQKNEETK